ncbi:MAG TPA: hypothetical protein VKU85_13180 [bacterium]|nr:hypothetical protein [bacterium]
MNTVAELFDTIVAGVNSLGAWVVWVALLLALGALPSISPRRTGDRGPRSLVAVWIGLLATALVLARRDVFLEWWDGAREAVARGVHAQSGRLDPLLARLPADTADWLAQMPWREIALGGLLLAMVLAFYLPRHSRFGHGR